MLTSKDAGVARIVIPSDVGRDEYIKKCYDTGRVSLYTYGAGLLRNVMFGKHIANDLEFPADAESYGAAVFYMKVPNREDYVIHSVLKDIDDVYDTSEYKYSVGRKQDSGVSVITGDSKRGSMTIRVTHTETGGKLTVSVGNGEDGVMDVNVSGTMNVESDKLNVLAYDEINFIVPKSDGKEVTKIRYVKGAGFSYQDEFGNTVTINEAGHTINHKNYVALGNGSDKAILFSQVKLFLTKLVQQVATSTAGGNPLSNAATLSAMVNEIDAIQSQYVKIQ